MTRRLKGEGLNDTAGRRDFSQVLRAIRNGSTGFCKLRSLAEMTGLEFGCGRLLTSICVVRNNS